jgi:hypothetical protein
VDPDPTFHPDADPDLDPDPIASKKAQIPEKVLKQAHIPYNLACYLQTDAAGSGSGPSLSLKCGSGCGPESGFLFDVDADPDWDLGYQNDADSCGSESGCGPVSLTFW